MVHIHVAPAGEDRAVLDRIGKLAHVARPRTAQQRLSGAAGELSAGMVLLLEKHLRQRQHVLATLAQRRHYQRENLEAIVKILSKSALGDRLPQLLMRGAKNANVDVKRARLTDASNLPILE